MSLLELRRVTKRYAIGDTVVRALSDVTIEVAPGEVVAVYGPSGSGKSTLLLVAAGMLSPDSGSVRFDGQDIASLTDQEAADLLRRDIGFVFQSFFLLPGITATDNAAVPLLAERVPMRDARERASLWLERVGLPHRMSHRPGQLSGGERQRVAIARALVNEPRLILADEPTGSLDSKTGRQMLELLADMCRERDSSLIVVTHDPLAAGVADRVLDLQDGRLFDSDEQPRVRSPALRTQQR